jgi:hypothetical protein
MAQRPITTGEDFHLALKQIQPVYRLYPGSPRVKNVSKNVTPELTPELKDRLRIANPSHAPTTKLSVSAVKPTTLYWR